MPRYNIELRTAERVWETLEIQADDHTVLRASVAKFIGELLQEHSQQIWLDQEWRVDVTEETGMILFIMHLFVTDSAALHAPHR